MIGYINIEIMITDLTIIFTIAEGPGVARGNNKMLKKNISKF